MATFNLTDNPDVVPTLIARDTIEVAKANMKLASKCRRDYENELQQYGDTVSITRFGKPTVLDKTAGTPIAVRQGLTTSKVDVKLDNHKVIPITVEDTARALSKPSAYKNIIESSGIALAEAIETAIWSLIATHGAADSAYNLGSYGTAIDKALLMEIRDSFSDAKVPEGYLRNCILSVDGYSDILNIGELTYAMNLGVSGQSPLIAGKLPPLFGTNFEESQLVPEVAGSPIQKSGFAFVKPAIALVSRPISDPETDLMVKKVVQQDTYVDPDVNIPIRVTLGYDMNALGLMINIDCLFGAKIIMPEWCWEIRH